MYTKILALVLLGFLSFSGQVSAETATSTESASTTERVSPKQIHNAAEVEKYVREVFAGAVVMAEIARCESKFRQYTDGGNVLRGGLGARMLGVFQFSEGVHSAEALRRGFDLTTLEGNVGYARHVYDKQGTDPWISSFRCWGNTEASGDDDTTELGANLSFGQTHPQVLLLQQKLNKAGFTVAESGPGSPGNETTMFGNLTRAALRKFQCDQNIACSGDEYSSGYGLLNSKTRTALLSYNGGKTVKAEKAKTTKKTIKSKDASDAQKRKELEKQIEELLKQVAELKRQLSQREE